MLMFLRRGKSRTLIFKQDSSGAGGANIIGDHQQSKFSDSGLHQLKEERQTVDGACYGEPAWMLTRSSYNTSVTHVENSSGSFDISIRSTLDSSMRV